MMDHSGLSLKADLRGEKSLQVASSVQGRFGVYWLAVGIIEMGPRDPSR